MSYHAEDAILTAETLINKSVNHIAFQLTVYCLEEIGKVFMVWYQFNQKEKWGEDMYVIPIDDRIKNLSGQHMMIDYFGNHYNYRLVVALIFGAKDVQEITK